MPTVDQPTLRYPASVTNGTFDVIEVDSAQAVLESVARICAVEQGTMLGRPTYGLPSLEHVKGSPDPDEVKRVIEEQEPRANITVIAVPEPGEGWAQLDIRVGLAGVDGS